MKKSCLNCQRRDQFLNGDAGLDVCLKLKLVLLQDIDTTTCQHLFLTAEAQEQIAAEERAIKEQFMNPRLHSCHDTGSINDALARYQASLTDGLVNPVVVMKEAI